MSDPKRTTLLALRVQTSSDRHRYTVQLPAGVTLADDEGELSIDVTIEALPELGAFLRSLAQVADPNPERFASIARVARSLLTSISYLGAELGSVVAELDTRSEARAQEATRLLREALEQLAELAELAALSEAEPRR